MVAAFPWRRDMKPSSKMAAGCCSSTTVAGPQRGAAPARPRSPISNWALTSAHDIAETTRVVVGPDEPFGGRSQDDMESDHWNALTEKLRADGVVVDAGELRQLPHAVVLSDRLVARLGRRPGGAA